MGDSIHHYIQDWIVPLGKKKKYTVWYIQFVFFCLNEVLGNSMVCGMCVRYKGTRVQILQDCVNKNLIIAQIPVCLSSCLCRVILYVFSTRSDVTFNVFGISLCAAKREKQVNSSHSSPLEIMTLLYIFHIFFIVFYQFSEQMLFGF